MFPTEGEGDEMTAKRSSPGIVVRHSRACPTRTGGKCGAPCKQRYQAWVWSARDGRKIMRSFTTPTAAKTWRSDAASALRKGTLAAPTRQTVEEAGGEWLKAAKAGEILKPDGARYKPSVLREYESDLRRFLLSDARLRGDWVEPSTARRSARRGSARRDRPFRVGGSSRRRSCRCGLSVGARCAMTS